MTSATDGLDELRRLLDERGVKWTDHGYKNHIWWKGFDGVRWHAEKRHCVDGWRVKVEAVITPEQAISATLGAGTCHDKNGFDPDTGFECTVCGAMVDSYMVTPNDTGHEVQFNYCPSCGRVEVAP